MPPSPRVPALVERELVLTPRRDGFDARVRSRVTRGWRIFAGAAAAGWLVMLVFGLRTLRAAETPPLGVAFMAFWVVNLAIGGPLALYWLLSGRGGREALHVAGRWVVLRRARGLGEPARALDRSRIVNVRVAADPPHVAFDHGTETLRVGEGLSAPDLERLAETLRGAG
jgi:hypothetical protein